MPNQTPRPRTGHLGKRIGQGTCGSEIDAWLAPWVEQDGPTKSYDGGKCVTNIPTDNFHTCANPTLIDPLDSYQSTQAANPLAKQ